MSLHLNALGNNAPLDQWLVAAGLDGMPVTEILAGFCNRLATAGMPLQRAFVSMTTLHPLIRAQGYFWEPGLGLAEYESILHRDGGNEGWARSPFRHMLETLTPVMRCRLEGPSAQVDFPVLQEFVDQGLTDWLGLAFAFGWSLRDNMDLGRFGQMGMVSSWATSRPGGFRDAELDKLQSLTPILALAIKAATNAELTRNIVGTYLGADAADHVISGEIRRGKAERIEAVILYADLRGFTRLADRLEIEPLIETLNAYFDCLGPAVEQGGGQVLKFLGDGLLASFRLDAGRDQQETSIAALSAAENALAAVERLNVERKAAGMATLQLDIALHLGIVMYGNIGTAERLDFTLIGPAVNEASRIENLCGQLDRNLLASASFARACNGAAQESLVSLGFHSLRGVAEPREVFGLQQT